MAIELVPRLVVIVIIVLDFLVVDFVVVIQLIVIVVEIVIVIDVNRLVVSASFVVPAISTWAIVRSGDLEHLVDIERVAIDLRALDPCARGCGGSSAITRLA